MHENGDDRYRLVANYTRDIILVLDKTGVVLWAAPSLIQTLGRTPESVVGHAANDLVHPDDRELQRAVFRQRVEERSWKRVEIRVAHANGSYITVDSLGVPILGPDGNVDKVLITARDITERKSMERKLRTILDQIPAAVWTTDLQLVVTSSIGGGLGSLGFVPSDMVGISLFDYFRGHERRDLILDVHLRAINGEMAAWESRWNDHDLLLRVQPLRDANGQISGAIGVTFDITDQKRAERRYQALFARNLAGVFRSTLTGRILEANDALARIFGHESPAAMVGEQKGDIFYDDKDREALIAELRLHGEIANFEVRLRRRDGLPVWVLLNESIAFDQDLGEEVLEGTIVDITARKLAEERIEYQAYHDALTDLPNRFLFLDRLVIALAQAKRHNRCVAVLFLDLDHFKVVNDTLAHSAGDDLLRAVASRVTSVLRSEDTVARLGGDEFVFILPNVQPSGAAANAARVAEKVLDVTRHPFMIAGQELFVTASIGIAMSPHDGTEPETLVKNADAAMYRAKDQGRNSYHFHTPLSQRRAEVRLTLEGALRRAIERDELFLVYQPQVELKTGRVSGFEALLRWNRPGVGVMEPKDFIPLAEEIGAIVPIGEWVLASACRQMRAWHLQGRTDLRLAINLSPRQFQHESLTRMVENVLEDTQLDASALEIEITESLSIRDSDMTIGRLSHFRGLGITVSLDDFGTGYSSLAHLRMLPIDSLKIDRSFITDLREHGAERAIVEAIVTMAHSLGLRVIAEGVETEAQQEILAAVGCDEIQGFVFSRPLPASEFVV
jgi:diguanylate cyclase (GGDEF)-like protein/PAS domain S-box-containing protein